MEEYEMRMKEERLERLERQKCCRIGTDGVSQKTEKIRFRKKVVNHLS